MSPFKKWIFVFSLLALFFFTTIPFFSSQVSFPIILPGKELKSRFYDYAGITHVHSVLSTGSGDFSTLSRSAYKADCAFLILTDLNPGLKPANIEGYRDEVLMIWAGEYSFLGGHLLGYDLQHISHLKGLGQLQIFFNDLLEKKNRGVDESFLVAAHPFLPQHSWENLLLPGLTGMEILNLDSSWHQKFSQNKLSVLWSFLILPFNPDLAYLRLYSEPQKELSTWDEILKKKMFIGFGGNDSTANAIPFPEKSFKFPNYIQSFKLLKDHVLLKSELTGSYKEDRAKIMEALRTGSFYFSVDLIGNPAGFYFIAQQRKQEFLSGKSLSLSSGSVIMLVDIGREINLPHEIVLFRDGVKVATSNSRTLSYEAKEPGSYRAIVRVIPTLPIPDGKTWLTWIFSNPIRVE